MATGGAVPAVLEAERSLVSKRVPSVLRWRVTAAGKLAGAAWVEYEETRRGALAFVSAGCHPSLRGTGAMAALLDHVCALHPRSHAWYVARDQVDRETLALLEALAAEHGTLLRHI